MDSSRTKLAQELEIIAVASGNQKKAIELDRVINSLELPIKIEMRQPPKSTRECAATFEGNAYLKAAQAAEHYGIACIADDSGLVCAKWDYAFPGPYSARLALLDISSDVVVVGVRESNLAREELDLANNLRLLKLLDSTGQAERQAKYVCVISLVLPDGRELLSARGEWPGVVMAAPKGSGGFGYDPIVSAHSHPNCSVAELSSKEKDLVSHRAQALQKLANRLRALIAAP